MKLKTIVLTFFLISSGFTQSKESMKLIPSLNWQKLQLEKEILNKIDSILTPLIRKDQYIVDTEIGISLPKKPEFKKRSNKLGKKKESKNNLKRIKINDNLPSVLPEDYIIFSKLGLEAPLVEDLLANELEQAKLTAKSASETLMKQNKKELPFLEQTWNYNQSVDIFTNLEDINIGIKIEKSLEVYYKEEIKKLIAQAQLSYGEIAPKITISYIQLKKEITAKKDTKFYLNYFSKISNAIGVVTAVLLLGLFALILFKKYEKLKKEEMENESKLALSGKSEEKKEKDKENNNKSSSAPNGGASTKPDEASELMGIKRFHNFLLSSPKNALMMVKRWINSEDHEKVQGLKALVQQLDNDDLEKIFNSLTSNLRNKWRDILDGPLSQQELISANQFISNEIVESIIIPSVIEDTELQELLLIMSPEVGSELILKETIFGNILMQLMQANILSSIFNLTPPELVNTIIKDSFSFTNETLQENLDRFKTELISLSGNQDDNSILNKIIDLLPTTKLDQESIFFSNIAKSLEHNNFIELGISTYPSELVPQLPENIVKNIFANFNIQTKVEILLSIEEKVDLFNFKMDILAPIGSKAKDLLDLEFEKAKDDLVFTRKIKNEKEDIWKKYIGEVRSYLNDNPETRADIEAIVSTWSESYYNNNHANAA